MTFVLSRNVVTSLSWDWASECPLGKQRFNFNQSDYLQF